MSGWRSFTDFRRVASRSVFPFLSRGVKLFSITASPNGSNDESFDSHPPSPTNQRLADQERSDSSDSSGLEDHCRTSMESSSFDHVAVHRHGYQSSSASDSIFHSSTEESFNRSFAIKPLRPISGISIVSSSSSGDSSGELNEDDTFAFKRSSDLSPTTATRSTSNRILALQQEKPLPARPVSVISTNSSSLGAGPDDTFAFKQSRGGPPLPFSLPKLLPNERRKTSPPPPQHVSPLRIKRKAVPRADEEEEESSSPRKARLVDGSEKKAAAERSSVETLRSFRMPTKGMRERPSLEESVLVGEGEDLSFSSQGESRRVLLFPFLSFPLRSVARVLISVFLFLSLSTISFFKSSQCRISWDPAPTPRRRPTVERSTNPELLRGTRTTTTIDPDLPLSSSLPLLQIHLP